MLLVCVPNSPAHTSPGEYLEYHFYVPHDDDYDVWVRVAANTPGKRLRIELNPVGQPSYSETFNVISKGWQDYSDVVWDLLYLQENEYWLRVYFETGGVNLCSVSVKDSWSRYYVHTPGTYSALFYADIMDFTPQIKYGNCDDYTKWSVDALVTTDPECVQAISEKEVACAIGWTQAGEKLTYQFETDGVHKYVNLSFRISSNNPSRRMEVALYTADPSLYVITSPGLGWDEYRTVTLENLYVGAVRYHDIYIKFLDGNVNICSFGVEYVE